MRLLVGCPVRDRGWILGEWFDYLEHACGQANIIPEYVFISGASYDNTDKVLYKRTRDRTAELIHISDPGLPPGLDRSWGRERLEFMVDVRNQLLGLVRESKPDLFLSLDSDILIHPEAIVNMIETVRDYDAVASRVYLHKNELITNWGNWIHPNQRMRRGQDRGGVFPADILMAVKMMKPAAYNVDYEFHFHGEDLGWSWACREAGLKFGVDARTISKHCLNRKMLDVVDPRVGY